MTLNRNRAEGAEIEAPGLAKSLRSRHVAMISIGGTIGAGLFVGSSSAIATIRSRAKINVSEGEGLLGRSSV